MSRGYTGPKGQTISVPDRCGVCSERIPDDDPDCRINPETGRTYHTFCVTEDWQSTMKDLWISSGKGYLNVKIRGDGAMEFSARRNSGEWGSTESIWIHGDDVTNLKEFING